MIPTFTYTLQGYFPRKQPPKVKYDFLISFDREAARWCLQTSRQQDLVDRLEETAHDTIEGISSFDHEKRKWRKHNGIYQFIGDSCLVRQCAMPGNDFTLDFDPTILTELKEEIDDRERQYEAPAALVYRAHEVKTATQAFVLFSLWNNWSAAMHYMFKQQERLPTRLRA